MGQIDSRMVNYAPLGIHLEPINRVNAVSDNTILINCTIWPKERTFVVPNKLFASYELIKNTEGVIMMYNTGMRELKTKENWKSQESD